MVGLSEHDMAPIYVSVAQTFSDLKRYEDAVTYFMKELDCRHGEYKQVDNNCLALVLCLPPDRLWRHYVCEYTQYSQSVCDSACHIVLVAMMSAINLRRPVLFN